MCSKQFNYVLIALATLIAFSSCQDVRIIEVVEHELGYYKTVSNCSTLPTNAVTHFQLHKSVDSDDASTKRYVSFVQTNIVAFPENVFQVFPSVRYIDFPGCGVKTIKKSNFINGELLTILKLSSNRIEMLPSEVFMYLSGLETLHLHDNEISAIDKRAFQGLSNLQILNLSGNKLRSISDDVFRPLVRLENLLLKGNPLGVLHDGFFRFIPNVKMVDLSECKITEIDPNVFLGLRKLQSLAIGFNSFERLYLPSLNLLLAQNSNIKIVNIIGTATKLLLQNNRLESVSITDMSLTSEINVENNSISDITHLTRANNLAILNLCGNPVDPENFSEGMFSHFPNLQHLGVANMNLTYFDVNILRNQTELVTLDLSGNNLTFLDVKQFEQVLPKLNKIYVKNNNFNEIRFGFSY